MTYNAQLNRRKVIIIIIIVDFIIIILATYNDFHIARYAYIMMCIIML